MGRKGVLAGFVTVLFLVLEFSAFLWAMERLSLDKALEIALRENSTLKKAQAEVEIARSALRLVEKNTFSPEIGVSQSIALTEEFNSGFSFTMKDSYSWGDSVEEKKARLVVEAAERALRKAQEEVKASVISVYLNILQGEQSIRLAEKNLELLRKKYEKTKAQFKEGNAAAFAVKEAEKKLKDGEMVLLNLQENFLVLKKKLNGILGRALETPFEVEPLPELATVDMSFDDLKALAVKNRIELADLEGQRKAVEADQKELKDQKKPSVKVMGEYKTDGWTVSLSVDPLRKNLDWEISRIPVRAGSSFLDGGSGEGSFGAGIVLNWIVSAGEVWREREEQYQLRLAQLGEDYRMQVNSITTEVEEKYYRFKKAEGDLGIRQIAIEVEREKYAVRKEQYKMGAIDEEALLGSEIAMMQAESDYEGNIYDLVLSWVDLKRSIGEEIRIGELFQASLKGVGE
ncbi:MAG: TolC family protein [Atribacterota bacterium]